jgi:hypothetical protein
MPERNLKPCAHQSDKGDAQELQDLQEAALLRPFLKPIYAEKHGDRNPTQWSTLNRAARRVLSAGVYECTRIWVGPQL